MTQRNKQIATLGTVTTVLLIVCIFFLTTRPKYFEYNGNQYKAGESFKDSEDCNTCSFNEKGELMCTLMACVPAEKPPEQDSVDISFSYENGEYKYSGIVQIPNPCYSVKAETIIRESYPEDVELRFTSIDSGEICTQVIGNKDVSGIIRVSESASIRVFLNDTLQQGVGVNR